MATGREINSYKEFQGMLLIDAREMWPKAFVLIRQACKNRLKKGAGEGSTRLHGLAGHVNVP